MNAQRSLIRVYLMAYEPPGWDMEAFAKEGGIDRLMKTVDICFRVGEGGPWPVATHMTSTPADREERGVEGTHKP